MNHPGRPAESMTQRVLERLQGVPAGMWLEEIDPPIPIIHLPRDENQGLAPRESEVRRSGL